MNVKIINHFEDINPLDDFQTLKYPSSNVNEGCIYKILEEGKQAEISWVKSPQINHTYFLAVTIGNARYSTYPNMLYINELYDKLHELDNTLQKESEFKRYLSLYPLNKVYEFNVFKYIHNSLEELSEAYYKELTEGWDTEDLFSSITPDWVVEMCMFDEQVNIKKLIESPLNETIINAIKGHPKFEVNFKKFASIVYAILEDTYAKKGGLVTIKSIDDLLKQSNMWKIVRRGNHITAVVCYKFRKGCRKIFLCGTNKKLPHQQRINDLRMILREDLRANLNRNAFAEVDEQMSIIMKSCGGVPIPNEYAPYLLAHSKSLVLLPDGIHYARDLIKNDKNVEKEIIAVSNLLTNLDIRI